ncbi:MAG: phosphohexomutase domain-containing protein [Nitrososphaerales archaeon]
MTAQPEVDKDTGLARPRIRIKFGTAGIRGIYAQEVSIREAIAVSFAVNELLGQGRFGVGYDSRKTSFILANVVCSTMNWYGSDVEDYGLIPTPVIAFNIKNSKLHAGFSVTASHNPPEYAGVKVFGTDGIEFSLEAEHRIETLIQKSEGYHKRESELSTFGATYGNGEAIYSYTDAVLGRVSETRKKFKILVDCANGTAGALTPFMLSRLGHHVVTVNAHPSEYFPGRLPEPMPETLIETASLSRSIHADFTIAHDGDADRIVMIDENGSVIPDYALSCLLLKIVVGQKKSGTVIISLNSSNALEKVATSLGCRVVRSRLGKTFEELYKRTGVFASEPSKVVDPRWGYWEDGIYAGIMLAQYLSEAGITLSHAIASIPRYFNLQKNLPLLAPLDYSMLNSLVKKKYVGRIEKIEEIDGTKVYFKDGAWLMLRSSGTESKVRVYVESSNESEARELLEDAIALAISAGNR